MDFFTALNAKSKFKIEFPSYVKEISLTKAHVFETGTDLTIHSSIF